MMRGWTALARVRSGGFTQSRRRGEERLLVDLGARIRDVRQGPDGWIYLLTDGSGGQLLRLVP